MKNKLAAFVLAVLMIFSVSAFATGPLLGVSYIPVAGNFAALSFGYDFGPVSLEFQKANLNTVAGIWATGLLWTPQIESFGYRVGADLLLEYWTGPQWVAGVWDARVAGLYYQGFNFVLGVSKTFGPIQLYGQLNLNPNATLFVVPVIGFNILFGDLIPDVTI